MIEQEENYSQENSPLALFREHMSEAQVTKTAEIRKDGGDELLIISLKNVGKVALPLYRFAVHPPTGRVFNPSYLGVSGDGQFLWDLVSAEFSEIGIELTGLVPGGAAVFEFAMPVNPTPSMAQKTT